MRLLLMLANQNIGYRKAAAPNNRATAFFLSTYLAFLRQNTPFFVCLGFEGAALKKAVLSIGCGLPVTAKNVA